MFFLCSEFSSPCQASRAIFKPSLPINPSSFLTDGGWGGGGGKRRDGWREEGQKKQTKKGWWRWFGRDWGYSQIYTHSCAS